MNKNPIRNKDLEFAVDNPYGKRVFSTFEEAAAYAVRMSISFDMDINVDVLCWTRDAANKWGGDYAVEEYDADPDASVSDRIVINAKNLGRIA